MDSTFAQGGLLQEVRGFLDGLRRDWPEIFRARPRENPPDAVFPAVSDGSSHEGLFRARVAHWSAAMEVTFGRVRVKDQRTLWGSCTPRGDLNFNWRLTLAPPPVLDYVVIHELAHRLEMNHSRRFWAHVERFCPEHRLHRRWLRKNGKALYRAKVSRIESASSGPSPESQDPSG